MGGQQAGVSPTQGAGRTNLPLIYQEILTAITRFRSNRQAVADATSFRNQIKGAITAAEAEANRNGYATEEATETLGSVFSFFNVGLKGLSRDFTTGYLGIPSSAPVLRSIGRLARMGHVEITTPVIQGVNDHELDEMADFIAAIDPEIPWHVFRLLPEREMKDRSYPEISEISRLLEKARKVLPYLYFHNFVGSQWVDTRCPGCGSVVIKRFSLGCGGDKLSDFRCDGASCPSCGSIIRLHGERTAWGAQEAAS